MDCLPILQDSNILGDAVECDKELSHRKVLPPDKDLHTPHSCRLHCSGSQSQCDTLVLLELLNVKDIISTNVSLHVQKYNCTFGKQNMLGLVREKNLMR